MAKAVFTFVFSNAQLGLPVRFNAPVYSGPTSSQPDGRLLLDATGSVSVYSDATPLTAYTTDGLGVSISGTCNPGGSITVTDGTPGINPFSASGQVAQALDTVVHAANFNAVANKIHGVDTRTNPVSSPLPTAPADRTRVSFKLLFQNATGTPNVFTFTTGGTDVFNKAAGSTSISLLLLNQGVTAQYDAGSGIWTVLSDDLPLSLLLTAAQGAATYGTVLATLEGQALTGGFLFTAAPTYNTLGTITGGPIRWTDSSTGVYTATAVDGNGAVTAFTATTTGGVLGNLTFTVTIPRNASSQINAAMTLSAA